MGLFREEKHSSLEYDIPYEKVWDKLILVLEELGKIEQKSKLGKRISYKSPMLRGSVTLDISLEQLDNKTKVLLSGSSFGGLLQVNYSKREINMIIEKLEKELEKDN